MRLDRTVLIAIVESIASRGSLAAAARAADISESTLHKWIVDSKRASERHDTSSPHYFEWHGISDYLAPGHIKRAKGVACMSLLYQVMEESRVGTREPLFDPSTARQLQKLVPITAHRDRAWFEARGLDYDIDRYEWIRDPLTDEILEPVYEYKQTMLPASLRQKILSGLVPIFRERAELDVKHTGQVVFRHEPGKYIPMAQRAQPGAVVDAQFSEVGKPALPSPPPRPDLEQLRALAAQLERDPNRVTRPLGVVLDSMGRPVGSTRPINDPPDDAGPPERPERTLRDLPRAYERAGKMDSEQQARAEHDRKPGAFPPSVDPRAPGAKAMKIG